MEKLPGSCRGDVVRRRKAQANGSQVGGRTALDQHLMEEANLCVGFSDSIYSQTRKYESKSHSINVRTRFSYIGVICPSIEEASYSL